MNETLSSRPLPRCQLGIKLKERIANRLPMAMENRCHGSPGPGNNHRIPLAHPIILERGHVQQGLQRTRFASVRGFS